VASACVFLRLRCCGICLTNFYATVVLLSSLCSPIFFHLVCCQYLPALRLSQTDILDVFNGIQFQPLDKNTYLRVQCFISQLEGAIPEVLYSVLMYNDSLVWLVFY